MKTIYALWVGLVIILVVAGFEIHNTITEELNKFEDLHSSMADNVGSKVLVDGDTLSIVDYSFVHGTYILSDNAEVHERFIKDNIIE